MGCELCTAEEFSARVQAELVRRNERRDINQMLELRLLSCDADGRSVSFLHPAQAWEANIYNTLHGGVISFLLDASMAVTCRAWTGDKATPTLDIHVSFLTPAGIDGALCTKAFVVHAGRSVVQMRAELWSQASERLCATADAIFYRADRKASG